MNYQNGPEEFSDGLSYIQMPTNNNGDGNESKLGIVLKSINDELNSRRNTVAAHIKRTESRERSQIDNSVSDINFQNSQPRVTEK